MQSRGQGKRYACCHFFVNSCINSLISFLCMFPQPLQDRMDPLPQTRHRRVPMDPPTCQACFLQPPTDIEPVHARFQFCRPEPDPLAIPPMQHAVASITTPTSIHTPTLSPYSDLRTTDQNRAHAIRFSVLQAQTCPPRDFPNASRQHSSNLTNLGPHMPFTYPVLGFNGRAITLARGRHRRFEGEAPHPRSISSSRHPRTPTTVSSSPRTLPLHPPSLVLMGGR